MPRLSRRSLLKAAARLGAGAGLALLGLGGGERSRAQEDSEGPYFRESASRLTLGNRYYEVDFDRGNGAITRIFDKRGGGVVSEGNADGSLWGLARGAWDGIWYTHPPERHLNARIGPQPRFQWSWNADANTLNLGYDIESMGGLIFLRVAISTADENYIDLTARLDNRSTAQIDWLDFPNSLAFESNAVERAILTYAGGVMLESSFFRKREVSRLERYPSWLAMGDFVWVKTQGGQVAVYPLHGESKHWQSVLGFEHSPPSASAHTYWRHAFALALPAGESAILPTVRLRIGTAPVQALISYRQDNRLDEYRSVREKTADIYEPLRRSPTLPQFPSWDDVFIRDTSFIDAPAVIHPAAFQEEGFEKTNPDWWPPAERYGGPAAYLDWSSAMQRDGNLMMPYTNPTNSHPVSLTAGVLAATGLTIDHIAARMANGAPLRVVYGYPNEEGETIDPVELTHTSPNSEWYRNRLQSVMAKHNLVDSDLVFEDQTASPGWWYDAHPDAESPLRWTHGWLDHVQRHTRYKLTAEGIYDRMSNDLVGGYYTIMLFEDLNAIPWAPEDWTYYPAAAVLFRDRALISGHNLAGMTTIRWSDGVNTWPTLYLFRQHLAMGQLLTLNMPTSAESDPWLPVVTAFSHHVIGSFADEVLVDFRGDTRSISESIFGSSTVVANWTDKPHSVAGHTLSPGGVILTADDGSVTGGVFQRFYDKDLAEGEHYLIEQRKQQGVIIRQPMGDDTALAVRALPNWRDGAAVSVAAFNRHDQLVGREGRRVRNGDVEYAHQSVSASEVQRRTFGVSNALGERNDEDGLHELDLGWTTTVAEVHDGRACRRETQMTPLEEWGMIAFEVTRDIFGGDDEADVIVEVEWYDEGTGERSLGMVYDGAVLHPELRHTDPTSGWYPTTNDRQWKTARYTCPRAAFRGRVVGVADIVLTVPQGVCIGKVTVTNADELERRTVAYYTIHDPLQGDTLTQGLHLRGWTDATQQIADLDLDGVQAIYAWDTEAASWLLYSPDIPARFNTLDTLEQGRAYYVRVRNGRTLHWPDAPYGGVGFHLQPGRNLVCWLGTPDKSLTEAIAPLRGMKAEPLVSVTLDGRTYDVEESREATEPLPYGQALWVEIDAVGPTRWLQF